MGNEEAMEMKRHGGEREWDKKALGEREWNKGKNEVELCKNRNSDVASFGGDKKLSSALGFNLDYR